MQDFTYTSTGNVSKSVAEIINGNSGLEECSRSCVTADGFSCKSFDYCQGSKTCLLHSSDRAQVPAEPGDSGIETCDNYISN